MGEAVALIKGEGRPLRRKEKRARIEHIRASLGLSDLQRTPTVLHYILQRIFMVKCTYLIYLNMGTIMLNLIKSYLCCEAG